MRQRLRRVMLWLILAMGGTTLYVVNVTPAFTTGNGAVGGCTRFTTNGLLTSVDFCYVLDCQSGFLGGAIQPCNSATPSESMLVDCPGFPFAANTTSQ